MLISIITINYNSRKGLETTIASVLEQTYYPIEYIIIDGGSTDGSKAVIEKFEDRITYWVSESDKGIYHAMNKGINVAKGDYLLFLNSGDTFFSNESLSYYQPYLNPKNPIAIIYGNIQVMSNTPWIKTYPDNLTFSYFIKDTLPHPASLIKRECFHDFMYDETLKITSDWKFFMTGICKKNFSYKHINTVISTFYLDGISSSNPILVQQERRQILIKEFFWQFKFYNLKQKLIRTIKK